MAELKVAELKVAELKANDNQLLCNMAIDDVVKKISIKFPQYPLFGEKFKAHCVEEAFEEIEVLIDDVAEGFDESVILESVFEDIEIKENDREPICTTIHYILSIFDPPPTSLNLAEITTKVEKKEISKMKEIVKEQAILLKPDTVNDMALLKLLIVGQNNHFPLLIYLIDTYIRYRLLEYQKLYDQLSQIDLQKKRMKFVAKKFGKVMELPAFFKNCDAMRKIAKKSKDDAQSEKALLWYDSSMKSFFRRLFGPLKMGPKQMIYKINDSLLIFAKYHVGILSAVNNILRNPNTKLPQQIDFWVIPKAMSSTNEFRDDLNAEDNDDFHSDDDIDPDDDDDDDDEIKEGTDINNLDSRLNHTDNLVICDIANNLEISKLSRTFFQIVEDVIKGQRSKRMVMIIDRRIDGKDIIENKKNYCHLIEDVDDNKQENDKLYAFLPKQSQNIPSGQYLHESMFNLSRIEVLPSVNGAVESDNNAIHVTSDLNNMCLLSIQIHEENVVRAYWYINGSSARFYINDIVNIWPLYFVEKELNKKDDDQRPKYQDVDGINQLIKENMRAIPLKDANFDKFFEENTKIKASKAYYGGAKTEKKTEKQTKT